MVTVIYKKPYFHKRGLWLIGWSKTPFEKCRCNIFHKGSFEEAMEKINSYPGKKFLKR